MQKAAFIDKKFVVNFIFVTSLFLMWGVLHSMSDVLNKYFQGALNVSKSQSGLIQLSVFGAYFVMSIPAGYFLKKFGYKPGVLLGLSLLRCRDLFVCARCKCQLLWIFQDRFIYYGLWNGNP
jgi:MFS transporter, FHS family, L-fucose permease